MKDKEQKDVVVTVAIVPRKTRLNGKIRLSWTVLNNTNQKIQILGYQVYFAGNGKHESMAPQWSKDESGIKSNPHVIMMLWPREKRTYEWDEVTTDYYKITSAGSWTCFVRFAYSISPSTSILFTTPGKDTILVESSDAYTLHEELRNLFMKNVEMIVDKYLDWDERPNVQHEMWLRERGVADTVLYTSSGKAAVVEFKAPVPTAKRLHDWLRTLSKYVEWVSATLAMSTKTVWAILFVSKPLTEASLAYLDSLMKIDELRLVNLIVLSKTEDERIIRSYPRQDSFKQ